jgi:hypothetical protein
MEIYSRMEGYRSDDVIGYQHVPLGIIYLFK